MRCPGQTFEIWGNGDVTRDFIHVDDVAAAFLEALRYAGDERVMNVGSGEGRSINQIVDDLRAVLGLANLEVIYKPERSADVPVSILDTELITRATSWRPRVTWIDGLQNTAAWLRATYKL